MPAELVGLFVETSPLEGIHSSHTSPFKAAIRDSLEATAASAVQNSTGAVNGGSVLETVTANTLIMKRENGVLVS